VIDDEVDGDRPGVADCWRDVLADQVDVERATGVLMVLRDCDPPAAQALLRTGARLSRRSAAAEARAVIAELLD
jgi:AmiR/NasT family two-component response regulator